MLTFLMATTILAALASPFALAHVWVYRLSHGDGREGSRTALGWISLVLVTAGVAMFWLSVVSSTGVATQGWGVYFHRWSRISTAAAALGFVCSVLGNGKKKWIVILVSIVIPLSWGVTKMFE